MDSKGFIGNPWTNYDAIESSWNKVDKNAAGDVVRLPFSMGYLGRYPEFNVLEVVVKCKYCNQCFMFQALKDHFVQCSRNLNQDKCSYEGNVPNYKSSIGPDGKPVNKANAYMYSGSSTKIVECPQNPNQDKCSYKRNEQNYTSNIGPDEKPVGKANVYMYREFATKIDQSHQITTTPNDSGSCSSQNLNPYAQSEVDTSSSNSSPTSESDKNNIYDSCYSMSSSSSNSVNIVRLKQEKPVCEQKNVIPIHNFFGTQKYREIAPKTVHVKQELSLPILQSVSSPKSLSPPTELTSTQQAVVLPTCTVTSTTVPVPCSTPETVFECHSYFEAVQPSTSFVTSVKESPSEIGKKTPKLIIRRVPHRNPKDVRRIAIEQGLKENSKCNDTNPYFLVSKGNSRPQTIKTSKHQVKKKICETRKIKDEHDSQREEYLREQQIALLTGRIETLNRQIATQTGHIGSLRMENEEYKTEIRNLRRRVEELETNTNSLIEQKNVRVKNDQKIEELKQSWERERFHFTQRLEQLQTELSDYKTSSTEEKQQLSYINTYLERKYGLQEALTKNFQKEKEILERHLSPGIHYQLSSNELVEIQRNRSVIYALLNGNVDCHLSSPSTISFPHHEQHQLGNRQIIDVSAYLPMDTSSAEMSTGNSRQLINVLHLTDKIHYQAFPTEVSNEREIIDLKEAESNDEDDEVDDVS